MPIIPARGFPTPPPPTPPDVEDPVKYRFSGVIMNQKLDEYGNLVVSYPPKTQPMQYWRKGLRYAIIRVG